MIDIYIYSNQTFSFQEKYSDIAVHLGARNVRAHRFVLAARSDNWGVPSLADVDSLGML